MITKQYYRLPCILSEKKKKLGKILTQVDSNKHTHLAELGRH